MHRARGPGRRGSERPRWRQILPPAQLRLRDAFAAAHCDRDRPWAGTRCPIRFRLRRGDHPVDAHGRPFSPRPAGRRDPAPRRPATRTSGSGCPRVAEPARDRDRRGFHPQPSGPRLRPRRGGRAVACRLQHPDGAAVGPPGRRPGGSTLQPAVSHRATPRVRLPLAPGARWLWAVAVDMMAAAMVVWGCSGLLMWWQMKSLRRWGAVALAASVVAATCLALAMHAVLSR